ncbi:unnamed protein product [Didymodactylos carnosus]|nr:unnamed protein product [Didymodactylos carnosus]CAF3792433.1 unnamed protein product [Didymodactylos carnosus]
MASAKNALESHASMFPLLHYQKTVLEKKFVSSSPSSGLPNKQKQYHDKKRAKLSIPFSLKNIKARTDLLTSTPTTYK